MSNDNLDKEEFLQGEENNENQENQNDKDTLNAENTELSDNIVISQAPDTADAQSANDVESDPSDNEADTSSEGENAENSDAQLPADPQNGEDNGENGNDAPPKAQSTPKLHDSFVQAPNDEDIDVSIRALNKGAIKIFTSISVILIVLSFLSLAISGDFNYISFVLGLLVLLFDFALISGTKALVADTIQKMQGKAEEFKFFNTYLEYRLYKGSELLKFAKIPYKEIEQAQEIKHLIMIRHEGVVYFIRKSLFSLGSKMKPFLLGLGTQIKQKNAKKPSPLKSPKFIIAVIAVAVCIMLVFAIKIILHDDGYEQGENALAISVSQLCETVGIEEPEARRYEQKEISVAYDLLTDIDVTQTIVHMSKKQLTEFDNSFKESDKGIVWYTYPPEKLYNEFEFVIFPEYDSFFIYNVTENTYNSIPKTDAECEYILVGYNSKKTTIEFLTFAK